MAEPRPDELTERIGEVIDKRYRIVGLLGKGGMGSVYRAEHTRLKRPVALKLLHPEYGAIAEIAKRFEREAFAGGRIDHENIVTVSDFGELEDGTLYLVMEVLDGESLGDVLDRDRRLGVRRALHIIRHVLRGLGHAHKAGIVHRDMKPENVVLVEHADDKAFAKILDFGIAKLVGEAEQAEGGEKLTQAGVAFGTPTYISPEQATGSNIDPRADLYSTSVMLYEMIAGVPPFRNDEKLKILAMHATREPPKFKEVAPDVDVPRELEAIIFKGLAKHPDDRYRSAEEYMRAIDAYLAKANRQHAPTPLPTARPTPTAAEVIAPGGYGATTGFGPRAPDHRRRWAIGGTVAACMLLLIVIVATAASGDDPSPAALSPEQRKTLLDKYEIELESGKRCSDRKKAVKKLRELGDKRAIPILKKARKRMTGGLAGIGEENVNACLTKDADKAIKYLQSL